MRKERNLSKIVSDGIHTMVIFNKVSCTVLSCRNQWQRCRCSVLSLNSCRVGKEGINIGHFCQSHWCINSKRFALALAWFIFHADPSLWLSFVRTITLRKITGSNIGLETLKLPKLLSFPGWITCRPKQGEKTLFRIKLILKTFNNKMLAFEKSVKIDAIKVVKIK